MGFPGAWMRAWLLSLAAFAALPRQPEGECLPACLPAGSGSAILLQSIALSREGLGPAKLFLLA